jgi:hypothetical protein
MTLREGVRTAAWNLTLGAASFLTVFIASNQVGFALAGFRPFEAGFVDVLGSVFLLYLGLGIPVVVGVLAHTVLLAAMAATGRGWHSWRGVATAIVSAPLVPLTPVVLGVGGATIFAHYAPAAAVAVVVYGLAVGWRLGHSSVRL